MGKEAYVVCRIVIQEKIRSVNVIAVYTEEEEAKLDIDYRYGRPSIKDKNQKGEVKYFYKATQFYEKFEGNIKS